MARQIHDVKTNGRTGPMPQMDGVISGWGNATQFQKITDTIVNYDNVKTVTNIPLDGLAQPTFSGIFSPMKPQEIFFKAEGQRNWKWWKLIVRSDVDINGGDDIRDFKGRVFRVLTKKDWQQAGYYEFDIVEEYSA